MFLLSRSQVVELEFEMLGKAELPCIIDCVFIQVVRRYSMKHHKSSSSSSSYILDTLTQAGRIVQASSPTVRNIQANWVMPRTSRPPNAGLAAQKGWMGSVARFWEVQLFISFYTSSIDMAMVENICAGLCGLFSAVNSISAGKLISLRTQYCR